MNFFEHGDYALAAFFGITLMEEVGKVVILGYHQSGGRFDKGGFYSHSKKYMHAVHHTLFMNSRVTRIYGDLEREFAEWFRKEKLFSIRNNALYLDFKHKQLLVPEDVIAKDEAYLLVCMGGEIYAEIQGQFTGTGPDEWERILHEMDAFRQRNGTLPQS